MKQFFPRLSKPAVAVLLFILFAWSNCTQLALAGIITINDIERGQFTDSTGFGGTNTNFNGNDGVIVGNNDNRHGFVTFDLSTLSSTVTSATLRLGFWNDFNSVNGTFDFKVFDYVSGDDANLGLAQTGAPALAMWTDLGSGFVYGSHFFNPTGLTEFSTTTIDFVLNSAAVADINSASGLFTVGLASDLTNELERVVFGTPSSHPHQLVLTTVPEPSSAIMFTSSFFCLLITHRGRSRNRQR